MNFSDDDLSQFEVHGATLVPEDNQQGHAEENLENKAYR